MSQVQPFILNLIHSIHIVVEYKIDLQLININCKQIRKQGQNQQQRKQQSKMLKNIIKPLATITMKGQQQCIMQIASSYLLTSSRLEYKFSNNNRFQRSDNPNQMPQQVKQMLQSQRSTQRKPQQLPLLKDISQLKSIDQLPDIFKKMTFLSKQQRQIVIRYLLSAIYQHKLPYEALLLKSMDVNLVEFPHLKLETEIYRVNYLVGQMERVNAELRSGGKDGEVKEERERQVLMLANQVNDLYYNCFNTTLKAVPPEHVARCKATLYKHFAQYNFAHLFNPTLTDPSSSLYDTNRSTLKKARQFLIQSLLYHKQILLTQHKKLQGDQIKKLKQQNRQRYDIKLNAIKQNIRKLVQSVGECLYALFIILNKQNRLLKDPFEHRNRKIQLLSLIDTYIPLYSIIPGIKQLSMMYYKLYKIKIQANYTSVGEPKTAEEVRKKIKQTVQQYNRLYKQCQDCLQESIKIDKFNNIKQISTTILSIKFMIGKTVKQTDNELKNSLALEAKSIIDKMKKEYKQPVQQYLLHLIKEMLNTIKS